MTLGQLRSPQTAIAIACVISLIFSVAMQCEAWRPDASMERENAQRWVSRYEPLRAWLPDGPPTRFQIDERANLDLQPPGARMFLARYAVAPKRITERVDSTLFVVDSDDPTPSNIMPDDGKLIKDFSNGVRLYQKLKTP
jgi:hypothetical protein